MNPYTNMYFDDASIGALPSTTIRVGSTGPAVVAWQKIIGVVDDGIFGPQTKAATQKWQTAHGLVADGIVGPLTWAAASSFAGVTGKTMLIVGGTAAAAGGAWWWWKRRKRHA